MQLEKNVLIENLQDIVSILSANATLPILSNIVIKEEEGNLILEGTDLEIFIKKTIKLKVELEKSICVNGKKFNDVIQSMPGDNVTITNEKGLKITSGKCTFKLALAPIEDYPIIPKIEGIKIKVEAQNLKSKLSKIIFAAATAETRYELNGILFDFKGGKLNLVATDGSRLALARIVVESKISEKFLVPQKALSSLIKLIGGTKELEIIISEDKRVKFICGNAEITTRLIDVEFPDYLDVIPKKSESKLKIKSKELYEAVKRASILSTQDLIALELKLEKNKVTVTKNTAGLGEVKEEIKAEYVGKEMTIGFNPKYLLDNLQVIEEEIIEIEITNEEKPVIIESLDSKYLLLPMCLV